MPVGTPDMILKAYELDVPTNSSLVERIWGVVLVVVVALSLLLGGALHNVKQPVQTIENRVEAVRARLVIEQKKVAPRPQPPKAKPAPEKAIPESPAPSTPIDLTAHPELAQKESDAAHIVPGAPVVRRVYGLRKVYAVGLGAQGGMADAVIGKLGNTLNAPVDTVKATSQELKGSLVAITSVTIAPRARNKVLPEISPAMKANKVSGVIKVTVTVDVDGRVKEARPLNDLGFGTAEAARAAALQWIFDPAMQGNRPVAVIITIVIRFELIEG